MAGASAYQHSHPPAVDVRRHDVPRIYFATNGDLISSMAGPGVGFSAALVPQYLLDETSAEIILRWERPWSSFIDHLVLAIPYIISLFHREVVV